MRPSEKERFGQRSKQRKCFSGHIARLSFLS
jgi:hypothetical protein